MNKHKQLQQAYQKLLTRLHDNWHDSWQQTQTDIAPKLQYLLETTKEKALAAQELTKEEIDIVSGYIYRDIHDAQQYLKKTGKELKDWLAFDWQLAEQKAWEMLETLADKATVDRLHLEEELEERVEYHTGEITGIGTLVCQKCHQSLHFKAHSHPIPSCPHCHHTVFSRLPL